MATEKRMMCVDVFKKNLCHYCNTYMSDEPCEPSECWVHDVIAQTDTVDAVEVSRLGELGKMMIPYLGCPRGMIGPRGEDGEAKNRKFEILELDPITDIDGNRWVPVLDRDLSTLKDKAQNIVEVVHGHNTYDHDSAFECSVCGFSDFDTLTADIHKYNYCPNCGAKMDGK